MVEALFVVVLVSGSLLGVVNYAAIPSPKESSSAGLENSALNILRSLDEDNLLTRVAFSDDVSDYSQLQKTLEATLAPNIAYNMSVVRLNLNSSMLDYNTTWSISNFKGTPPTGAKTVTYAVTSPKVSLDNIRDKVSVGGVPITLYILNCTDAYTWFPAQGTVSGISKSTYEILSPWFETTVMINSTAQLRDLVGKNVGDPPLKPGSSYQNAIVVNPLGGTYPITIGSDIGDPNSPMVDYSWELGKAAYRMNWTYLCYVGYPQEYVSGSGNGLKGQSEMERRLLDAFLTGLDNRDKYSGKEWRYKQDDEADWTDDAVKTYTKYGVFPGENQPGIFVLGKDIEGEFHLYRNNTDVFMETDKGSPGSIYMHYLDSNGNDQKDQDEERRGAFFSLCLPQIPDKRISTIGILQYYKPRVYRTPFTENDSIRFVALTLAQLGAD
jgi:hypothetical protein